VSKKLEHMERNPIFAKNRISKTLINTISSRNSISNQPLMERNPIFAKNRISKTLINF